MLSSLLSFSAYRYSANPTCYIFNVLYSCTIYIFTVLLNALCLKGVVGHPLCSTNYRPNLLLSILRKSLESMASF